jgi:low affinity Fe/Cu permease
MSGSTKSRSSRPREGGTPLRSTSRALEGLSRRAAAWTGGSWAFAIACAVVLAWLVSGPLFGYSDTWQLVINTSTTIVTFLMVFLIQRAQNKESKIVQLKLKRGSSI